MSFTEDLIPPRKIRPAEEQHAVTKIEALERDNADLRKKLEELKSAHAALLEKQREHRP